MKTYTYSIYVKRPIAHINHPWWKRILWMKPELEYSKQWARISTSYINEAEGKVILSHPNLIAKMVTIGAETEEAYGSALEEVRNATPYQKI